MKKILALFLLMSISALPAATGYYNVLEYGAQPDGQTLCTEAIQKAIDDCAAAGGGKVVIPAGKYLTRPLFLKSNIEVEVLAGAVLIADTTISEYPSFHGKWEGIEKKVYASLFTGSGLENVSITGRGTLDGQGEVWWKAHYQTRDLRKKAGLTEREQPNPPGAPLKYARPRVINLYDCNNVLIRDLTIIDSPSWTIHPVYCEDVTIDNITIHQPYESPNTDGINPESCKNVRIINCFVDCGDDCVTIKSGYNEDGRRVNRPCENIVVANCTFKHGRSAIGIGSETSGGVWNVVISNCVFKDTYRGLRIKTARGRGNVVKNIRATNIVMENVGTGISLDMFYGSKDKNPQPVDVTTPHFKNIRYSHITGTHVKKAGEILGLPEAPMEGVVLEDVYIEAETGLKVLFTNNLRLENVEVNVKDGAAITVSDSREVVLDNVTSRQPLRGSPVLRFENVAEAFIENCSAATGTDTFLEVRGKESGGIVLRNNRLDKAKQKVKLSSGASEDAVRENENF